MNESKTQATIDMQLAMVGAATGLVYRRHNKITRWHWIDEEDLKTECGIDFTESEQPLRVRFSTSKICERCVPDRNESLLIRQEVLDSIESIRKKFKARR